MEKFDIFCAFIIGPLYLVLSGWIKSSGGGGGVYDDDDDDHDDNDDDDDDDKRSKIATKIHSLVVNSRAPTKSLLLNMYMDYSILSYFYNPFY
jgi:hypothetical protein